MSVYVLAQLRLTNVAAYRRYQARFGAALRRFNGKVLVADEHPILVEGDWIGDKVVLIQFPDEAEARCFMNDQEYKEISKDRQAGAKSTVLLIQGSTAV